MSIEVVFETHALSEDNERGIATGWLPGRLSAEGRQNAADMGRRRREDGIAAVFLGWEGEPIPRTYRWCWYHNHMALRKTTVMVDENDLELIKEAAAREGRPESEYFREAFHIAAMGTRRWGDQWDIPTFDLGGPIREDDIKQAAVDGAAREQAEIEQARRRAPDVPA